MQESLLEVHVELAWHVYLSIARYWLVRLRKHELCRQRSAVEIVKKELRKLKRSSKTYPTLFVSALRPYTRASQYAS
jgi:hypothetical protein